MHNDDMIAQNKKRFVLGMVLNIAFVFIELYYGFVANSVALVADAVHKASDVLGLGLAWFSYYLSQRQATHKFTYGFKNATILAAFLNSVLLILAIGNIVWESSLRLFHPEPVVPTIVIWVATIGVIMNGATTLLFVKNKNADLNILSAFLNMALDTLLSFAVVVGGIFILWKGWILLDPILGIVIAIAIIFSTWNLFRESLNLIFQAVPAGINIKALIEDIEQTPGVIGYHDLHVWALSTIETALSVHIITAKSDFNPELSEKLTAMLSTKYAIHHATIQLEIEDQDKSCLSC